jgi:hypothetical protein
MHVFTQVIALTGLFHNHNADAVVLGRGLPSLTWRDALVVAGFLNVGGEGWLNTS